MNKFITWAILYLSILFSHSSCLTFLLSEKIEDNKKDNIRIHEVKSAAILPDGSLRVDFVGNLKGKDELKEPLRIVLPMNSPELSYINSSFNTEYTQTKASKELKKNYKYARNIYSYKYGLSVKPKWKTIKTDPIEKAPRAQNIPVQMSKHNNEIDYEQAFLMQKDSMPNYCVQVKIGERYVETAVDKEIQLTLYNFETFKKIDIDYGHKKKHYKKLLNLFIPITLAIDIATFPFQFIFFAKALAWH